MNEAMLKQRKRKAAEAGLTFAAQNFRVDVVMDPDWVNNSKDIRVTWWFRVLT